MESKIYLTITISSILAFALIAAAGISTIAFVNVLAQEVAITPEGSINDTMSGQNASQWASNATLVYAQGESEDTGGMTEGQTDPNGEGEVDLGTGGP